jgi:hypothetical protein
MTPSISLFHAIAIAIAIVTHPGSGRRFAVSRC